MWRKDFKLNEFAGSRVGGIGPRNDLVCKVESPKGEDF